MPRISLDKLRREILDLYAPPLRAKTTLAIMRQVLDELDHLGKARWTSDLTPTLISQWLRSSPPERSAMRRYCLLRALRAICGYAIAAGYLKADPFAWRSPAQWVDLRSHRPQPSRHLTAAQMVKVLKRAQAEAIDWPTRRLEALIFTLAFTGMRKKEALGLRLEDVDLGERIIHIRPNPRRPLKTPGSAAPLAIPEPLADVLERWIPDAGPEWLFPGMARSGPWLTGGPGNRALDHVRDLGRRAGAPRLSLLSFRHTIGTLAEAWGLGQLELQRLLRHTRPTTQTHYRHIELDNLRGTASKIRFDLN